jgi:hypothetical protein
MASTATILDTSMQHWPPTTTLVSLSPPLQRFTPRGERVSYGYVAIHIQSIAQSASEDIVFIYPSNAEGGFEQRIMQPIDNIDHGTLDDVIRELGYTTA